MAIAFLRASVVTAGWPEDRSAGRAPDSAVAASAYLGRRRLTSSVTGKTHDYRRGRGPVLHSAILLPKDADPRFLQPGRLWSAAERAELVVDRTTGKPRFRRGGELARRFLLAAPKELRLSETIELVEEFARQEFVDRGLAVEIATHPSDDPATGNVHVHMLVTSRPIDGRTFGKRATFLAPGFARKKGAKGWVTETSRWPQRWADFQDRYFARNGIQLTVDPIAIVPRLHEGRARRVKDSPRAAINTARAAEEAKILRDPAEALKRLVERRAVFGISDLERMCQKAGIKGMEARRLVQKTLLQPDVIALDPPLPAGVALSTDPCDRARQRRYTTKAILEQEHRIRAAVRRLTSDEIPRRLPPDALETAEQLIAERGLEREQADAVRYLLQADGVSQAQGRAGTGKSVLATVVVDALVQARYRVVGLAPTNAVAGAMRRDGFPEAKTLHRFLQQLESGRRLDGLHVLMVDEAAMVDVALYDRLLTAAAKASCHVMLIGDDRQLPPVGRGGAYSLIRRELGNVELKNVKRQRLAWMRDASVHLSEWNIAPAIKAYNEHGAITWTESLDAAARRLVEDWRKATVENPGKPIFVYAGTNRWVNELNRSLQSARWQGIAANPVYKWKCSSGEVAVRIGERLQFRANDVRKGIYNGVLATVTGFDAKGIHVQCDDGTTTSFNPSKFTQWDLGYAGTCYRGQGKTQDLTFLLYDHPFVWGAATTYVGLTRHRDQARLYVPRKLAKDEAALIRQMSRTTEQLLASDLTVANQHQAKDDLIRATYPIEPQIPLTIRLKDKGRLAVDIALEAAQRAARQHFESADVVEFIRDYGSLCELARSQPATHPAELLRRQAAGIAHKRGFRPSTGEVDRTCLHHQLLEEDQEDLLKDERLRGDATNQIDVQPLAFPPAEVPWRPWKRMAKRLRELDRFVLDAILERIHELRGAFARKEDMSGALGLAAYLVKISKALRYSPRDASWPGRRRAIRAQEPTPRLVWKPFRLWHRPQKNGELLPLEWRSPSKNGPTAFQSRKPTTSPTNEPTRGNQRTAPRSLDRGPTL